MDKIKVFLNRRIEGVGLYVYSSLLAFMVTVVVCFAIYPAIMPKSPDDLVRWGLMKAVAVLAGMIAEGGAYHFFDKMTDHAFTDRIKEDSRASAYVLCTFLASIAAIVCYAG